MFEAATTKFAHSVGEDVVLPVPNFHQNGQCQAYHVVIKKNRKWRWQSATYSPSPFTLSQLLVSGDTDPLENHLKATSGKALVYNKVHKLSVKGKVGAKIKVLLDVELDGSDTVDVEAKFGTVKKSSLDQTQLMGLLNSRHLDLDNQFLKQVREHPRKVLCVVVASYELSASGVISASKDIAGEEKIGDEKLMKSLADATEDISIDDDNENSMTVPPGTVVAYRVCELLIRSDRSVELIMQSDLCGGFKAGLDEVDHPHFSSEASCSTSYSSNNLSVGDPSLDDLFSPLLSMEESSKVPLVHAVLQMCTFPKDVDTFLVMIKQALALASEQESSGICLCKTTILPVLKAKYLCPDQDWASLLQLSGFNFIADGSVEYPKMSCAYLPAMVNLFKALIEMDDNQLIAFSQLKQDTTRPLMYLLIQSVNKSPLARTDSEIAPIYSGEDKSAENFINTLGFTAAQDGKIQLQLVREESIQGAARAVYALFWLKHYHSDSSWKCVL